ncbi:nicotinamide riboside transporter PnuC [Catellatospora bangladeshensis]|uniref:Putative nicotinamide mononucleotide transporter n=1 Tax=Catellatospora bangladeshensis TaxID=310355 RepID=A0A8J3J6S7_9ACTN|nr:nicotinamide riboside transporter PnuC [Catellatospora bangladeshensis]GIF79157.1 putative nicotinamide mononucleotide transporter [Catellatospora bangladeshensis]
MLDWLLSTAFTVRDTPMTWAEVLGFLTGVLNVWLLVRQNVANWAVGILNVLLLLVVFWTYGLYADASLQLVYVALGLLGWWQWLRRGTDGARLEVSRTTRAEWTVLAVVGMLATVALWLLLDRATDSTVPLPDALTTVLSLAATYLQTRKKLESWWIWIVADLIYIPLYLYKGLWLTGALYVVFLGLCVAGLLSWQRALRGRAAEPVPA